MCATYRLMLAILIFAAPASADWKVVAARWNPDANPWAKNQVWQGYIWSEGWSEEEQFYPENMKPAGSIHVILRNDSKSQDTILLTQIDGTPIGDIITKPDRAGRIIWYRVESPKSGPRKPVHREDEEWKIIEPSKVEPGGWAECTIRFRTPPTKSVELRFRTGAGDLDVSAPMTASRTRIESVCFSPGIDRLYVYLRALDGKRIAKGNLSLDGCTVSSDWSPGPAPGDLMLVQAKLGPKWEYGSHHLIDVVLPRGERLACPVRAWDSFFAVGLFGTMDAAHVANAKTHGINTYFSAGVSDLLNQNGLNVVPSHNVGEGRDRTPTQSGVLFYYNMDEPDAHDFNLGEALPVMDRLGCHAMETVLPTIRYQRERDPRVPNLVLVDNTFKPLNHYVYGQTPDIYSTDPYVPLNGRQLDYVYRALDVARDACAPRPVISVLWACGLASPSKRLGQRPPTAEEERMMAFYALGCGVKGVGYFADITSETGEGKFLGASDIESLWTEIGRTNQDIRALSPYLSIGCPIPASIPSGKVWARTILCGPNNIVLIVVNKDHWIGFETKYEHAWHTPAEDVALSIPLPPSFRTCTIREIKDGKLVGSAECGVRSAELGRAEFRLASVDTARAFVISGGK